jgi:hypothetical protein
MFPADALCIPQQHRLTSYQVPQSYWWSFGERPLGPELRRPGVGEVEGLVEEEVAELLHLQHLALHL